MEELKVTPKELKQLIDASKSIGSGFFGTTFEYKDRLIKLDKGLYNLLKVNDISNADWVVKDYYKFGENDYNNREQIENLANKQSSITLTKLPLGVVDFKDVDPKIMKITPGIIIPYHKDHEKLEKLSRSEYKRVLIILRKLLSAVRELADNEIAQEDFVQYNHHKPNVRAYNVMYKEDTPQIIDMSGVRIKEGKEFKDAEEMFRSFGNLVLDYFEFNGMEKPQEVNSVKTDTEIENLIDTFEKETKGK